MRVFFDASGWVPSVVTTDQWRIAFQRIMRELRQQPRLEIVTTTWTLYEAMALARRQSHALAVQLHQQAMRGAETIEVGSDVEREAVRRFLRWGDKRASVVDHANGLVAVQWGCEAIVSFDDDFAPIAAAAGLRLLSK